MDILNVFVFQLFTNQTIFMGLLALVGLLLQRKKLPQVIDGVVKTVIGLLVLSSGAGIIFSSLSEVVTALNNSLGVAGTLPINDAAGAMVLSMEGFSRNSVLIFLFAFLLHLVIVKLVPNKNFKNVYLTAHLALFHACFMAITLPGILNTDDSVVIIASWLYSQCTLLCAFSCNYQKACKRVDTGCNYPWLYGSGRLRCCSLCW